MFGLYGYQAHIFRVFVSLIILGITIGAQSGAFSAQGDRTDKRISAGAIVLLVLSILIEIAAFIFGISSFVSLFFAFYWKTLLIAIIAALIPGIISGLIAYWITRALRKRRYMRNPLVNEVVAFCKQHNVVGVQCFPEGLRFFTQISNSDYCKSEVHTEEVLDEVAANLYKATWNHSGRYPDENSAGFIGSLNFAARGYPNLTSLPIFAAALAKKLGDCGYASHEQKVCYDTRSYGYSTTTVTHHIILFYKDCFVYDRKSYREAKTINNKLKASQKAAEEKKNTWE